MDRVREEIQARFNTSIIILRTLDKTRTHQLGQYDEWNIMGQWIGKEKKYMHISTQAHTQNMEKTTTHHLTMHIIQ